MPLSLRGTTIRNRTQVASGFTPATLFSNNEQGAWYDPSDFDTMFQNSSGSVQVTAAGQQVGLILDKSRGLTLGPELVTNGDFSNGTTDWIGFNSSTRTVVSGELKILSGSAYGGAKQTLSLTVGKTYRFSVTARCGTSNQAILNIRSNNGATDLASVATTSTSNVILQRVWTATEASPIITLLTGSNSGTDAFFDNVSVREVLGNHAYQSTAANRPTLQQDSNGKYYLDFDGTNDSLVTNSVDFSATDKMTAIAGVTKNSDLSPGGTFLELSANSNTNNGTFAIFSPGGNLNDFVWRTKGTIQFDISGTAAAPTTKVFTATANIAGDTSQLRLNGNQVASSNADQGTGNYGNYPLYIGARGGTFAFFSGRIYSLIIRGAATSDRDIQNTENWVAAKTGAGAFSPSQLFANSEVGVWYDPSDYSTMFTDTAGTTPVTAVEQQVGKILDKSGRGNHATAANSTTARPTLRARYNLLTYSEQFDNAVWTKGQLNAFGSGSVANTTATADPLGGNTADFLQENSANGLHNANQIFSSVSGVLYSASVYAKQAGRRYLQLTFGGAEFGTTQYATFDLATGTVSGSAASTTSIVNAGNGWYRLSYAVAATSTASTSTVLFILSDAASGRAPSYTGDSTSGIYLWGAQLTTASDNTVIAGNYQRIAAATDYDSNPAKFPPYLAFDGSDDAMSTASINFTGTDKMSVWAGVTKLSDAAVNVLAELSAISSSNIGAFAFYMPDAAGGNNYAYGSRGSTSRLNAISGATFSAPITNVLTGTSDIAADSVILRVAGVQAGSNTSDQGTGNYGNYPLYIGARATTSLFLNGRIYSLIVRGAASSASEIGSTELWVSKKTGVGV